MKKRLKWAFIGVCVVVLAVFSVYATGQERTDLAQVTHYANGDLLDFEAEYEDGQLILHLVTAASVPSSAEVHYTLDGSPPTEDSPVYTEPLVFPADWSRLPAVRAFVSYKGERSPEYTRTVFAEEEAEFPEGMRVLMIYTDPENLYSYETGILVEGKTKDDYIATHSNYDELPPWQKPANFHNRGDEWVRPAHVDILDSTGRRLGSQDVGIAVSGGASAYMEIKSLRLEAKFVDSENKNFPDSWAGVPVRAAAAASMPHSYNKIVAKNGGQDRDKTFLITQVVYPRAVAAGLNATPDCVPAVVYLNGSFYSYVILQPHINRDYLGNLYGLDKEFLEYNKYSESAMLRSTGLGAVLDRDPDDPEARAELEQAFDLDNLLLYYAFEMCCNNRDVLANNYGIWRWTGAPDPANPLTDGRFRFVLYDVDNAYSASVSDAMHDILAEDGFLYSRLLAWILKDPARMETFVNICLNMADVTLAPDLVTAQMDRFYSLQQSWKANRQLGNLIASSLGATTPELFANARSNAAGRQEKILNNLVQYLGLSGGRCVLELSGDGCGSAIRENLALPLNRTWHLNCLSEIPVTLEAAVGPGRTFSHWLVNGEAVYDRILRLDRETLKDGSRVTVRLVTQPAEGPMLIVNEIDAKGDMDWVELKNVGSEPLDLGEFYISNREAKPDQCGLPDLILEPGDLITLNCKNNMTLLGYLLNFNFAAGEHLYVNRADGSHFLDYLIPEMNDNESWGLDPCTGAPVWYAVSSKDQENPSLFDSLN